MPMLASTTGAGAGGGGDCAIAIPPLTQSANAVTAKRPKSWFRRMVRPPKCAATISADPWAVNATSALENPIRM
jgi:hypothetical protein